MSVVNGCVSPIIHYSQDQIVVVSGATDGLHLLFASGLDRMRGKTVATIAARIAAGLNRRVRSVLLLPKEKISGIIRIPPCYCILASKLGPQSIAVDLGTGRDANFSHALIRRFGMTCFGFEPTRRHHQSLKALSEETGGRFRLFGYAVAGHRGTAIFHEVSGRESGSLADDHANVLAYPFTRYSVETFGLSDIFRLLEVASIDVMKIDVEGAEYDFFGRAEEAFLKRVGQFVVEFHHHCIRRYTRKDNQRVIDLLAKVGFTAYSVDGINYLFYRSPSMLFRKSITCKERQP
jgi:FkbM family methyltransferase